MTRRTPPEYHARSGHTYAHRGSKWYRALGAHQVGEEDTGWFDRPKKAAPPSYRDVPTHRPSRPGVALVWLLVALGGCRTCVSIAAERTGDIEREVARGNLGPEGR